MLYRNSATGNIIAQKIFYINHAAAEGKSEDKTKDKTEGKNEAKTKNEYMRIYRFVKTNRFKKRIKCRIFIVLCINDD